MQTKSAKLPREKRQLTKKLINMKRFSEQLHKKSQTVKLKKSEQADLRERLVSYMEYHPLPAAMKAADISNTKKTPRSTVLTEAFGQYTIPFQALFKFGSVAAVFVLLVVPFMAERTVPGDTLYAVKVQFNEEVRSTLTWGSYEKVEWETTRLNRRIAEARLLADEGLLTPEAEAEVAAAVKEHSDNAKREIEVLRETDADEAAIATITFDSSLQVQAQVLQDGVDNTSTTTTDRGLISEALDESLEKPLQTEQAIIPAYGKLMARVEMNTTRVQELRDSLVGTVSDKALADVTRRIEDIDRAVTEAITQSESETTELVARMSLVDVLTRTQKLIVFMTDLEVREQVTIESVVPVVLTVGEMQVDRSKREAQLDQSIEYIAAAIAVDTNSKLTAKLVVVNQQLVAAQASLQQLPDYTTYIAQSIDVLALATDALQLIEKAGVPILELLDLEVSTTTPGTATSTDTVVVDVAATSSEEAIELEVTESDNINATTSQTAIETL
jgi:hypothetical protein